MDTENREVKVEVEVEVEEYEKTILEQKNSTKFGVPRRPAILLPNNFFVSFNDFPKPIYLMEKIFDVLTNYGNDIPYWQYDDNLNRFTIVFQEKSSVLEEEYCNKEKDLKYINNINHRFKTLDEHGLIDMNRIATCELRVYYDDASEEKYILEFNKYMGNSEIWKLFMQIVKYKLTNNIN